jgi:hypothetical protein
LGCSHRNARWFHTLILILATSFQLLVVISGAFGVDEKKSELAWKTVIAIVLVDLTFIVGSLKQDIILQRNQTSVKSQRQIYKDLLSRTDTNEAKEVKLFQYSGRLTSSFVRDILSKGIKVILYVQHPDSFDKTSLNRQYHFLLKTLEEMQSDCREKDDWGELKVFGLSTPVTVRAVLVDRDVLAWGAFVFEQEPENSEENYSNDKFKLMTSDEVPGTVVYSGSQDFDVGYEFLKRLEKESEKSKIMLLHIQNGKIINSYPPKNNSHSNA